MDQQPAPPPAGDDPYDPPETGELCPRCHGTGLEPRGVSGEVCSRCEGQGWIDEGPEEADDGQEPGDMLPF